MTATLDAPEGTSPKGRWNRAAVLFIVGYFLIDAATAGLMLAMGKQAYDISGRELDLGLLGLAEFLPAAFLVLVSGSVADRYQRRYVATIGTLGQAAAAVLIIAWVASSPTAVGPLFGLALLGGVAKAFTAPATRALPTDLVRAPQLPWLMARWTITFQLGLVIGPVLAGMLYAVDPRLPFVVIACLFAAGAVAFSQLPPPLSHSAPAPASPAPAPLAVATEVELESAPPVGRLHEAMEGLRLVRQRPVLLGAISLDLFAVLFGGAVALLPAIADERLGVGAVGLGWLRAAPGLGAAAMLIVLAVRPLRSHVGVSLFAAVAVFGIGTIVLGATHNYAVAFVALVVLAAADALSVFIRVTLIPLSSPPKTRGRVLAVENVFIGASNELGAFESGVTGQWLGPGPAVVLGGFATLVVAATWSRLFPALRHTNHFPAPAED